MERRKTLKVSISPDTSAIQNAEDSSIFTTPKPKLFTKKKITPSAIPPLNIKPKMTKFTHFIKPLITQSLFILTFSFVIYRYFNNKLLTLTFEVNNFISENNNLKQQISNLANIVNKKEKTIENYATVEKGSYINYLKTSSRYKYGLFGYKSSSDATQVMLNSVYMQNPFVFSGSCGNISVIFNEPIFIDEIVLIHPKTKDRSSAVKEFEVYGVNGEEKLIGKYNYELTDRVGMRFKVSSDCKFNQIMFVILSNHGKKDYTCIYNIQVYGYR